ncbi:MAG: PQQ-dependent sugar dehydrogenase [Pseudomonadaceae bacterium]|nr:PQQ-dependent sugar dehydrogenase [Pseudomonadaceae bacterium]
MTKRRLLTSLIAAYALIVSTTAHAEIDHLSVPDGFRIELLTDSVPGARQMAWHESGLLFVGSLRGGDGRVYAVDTRQEPAAVHVLGENMKLPSGVALRGDSLFVAALDRVLRFDNVHEKYSNAAPSLITAELPDETHHGWKYLRFAPDGALFVPVGAPCNICLSDDPRFASILRMDPDTGTTEIYAHGVRNSVGFDFHPDSGELWFSDNGRDWLGDDTPPEEINVASEAGLHFGYPFLHGHDVVDPEFGGGMATEKITKPRLTIQAHSAAIGIAFYTHSAFGERFKDALFIAERGSWNRTEKVGHQVTVAIAGADGSRTIEPFVTGFLDDQKALGRPNDVLPLPNGDLLISDDQAGSIYRVRAVERN